MKEEKRETMVVYRSFYDAIRLLSVKDQAAVWNAVFNRGFYMEKPKLSGMAFAVWLLIEPQIEANIRKYENGKQKKSKAEANKKQNGSKAEGNVNVNVNGNVNDNGIALKDFNEELFNEYLNTNKLIEICKLNSIEPLKAKVLFHRFIKEQGLADKEYTKAGEMWSHFNNWLKIQKKKGIEFTNQEKKLASTL